MAVNLQKKSKERKTPTRKMNQGTREVKNEIQLESTIMQKKTFMFNSSCTLFSF